MTARVLPASEGIDEAARVIREGGLVAFPTETVYGLGANAFDARAVAHIFEAKERPAFDPLVVHICDVEMLQSVTSQIPKAGQALAQSFWPGPLTLILNKTEKVPGIVTSGLSTVATRMPSGAHALKLIDAAQTPIAAPSANTFGHLSPTRADHVFRDLGERIPLILDGGQTTHGIESTIVDVTGDVPTVLRHGAIPIEQIADVVGDVDARTSSTSNPTSPGQLDHHYAPNAPLRIAAPDQAPSSDAAIVTFDKERAGSWSQSVVLSPAGDLNEAAANLFEVLHQLDEANPAAIYIELVPDVLVGRAINDRIRRACASAR